MMKVPRAQWSKTFTQPRRDFLKTISAVAASAAFPPNIFSSESAKKGSTPFSQFVDVTESAGLKDILFYGEKAEATYITEIMGGGCAFFDYDNDGWMDIFILGGRRLSEIPAGASNHLYRNNRDGTFTDVTKKAGLTDAGWAIGVCVGDYNNDGFEDLFVTYFGQNRLYRNNGDGTFTDVTKQAGLGSSLTRFGSGCTFVDYNRDGWLDLFVANYADVDIENLPKPSLERPNCSFEAVPVNCGPSGLPIPTNLLYRNNRDGTFTDVSKESGIASFRGSYALTAVAFDVDEDGWPDIFVAGDSTPSLLLMNNHNGTFREEGLMRGVALSDEGREMAGMGVGVGDYDCDGHLDIVRTHFMNQPTGLYHCSGKGEFEDVTMQSGLMHEQRFVSWGIGLVDLDNDGFPDIFLVTGQVYPELEAKYPRYPRRGPRLVFRNLGNGTFQELDEEKIPALASRHVSRGCAFGDFDNDGDLDIVIMNQNEPPSLLRNDAPSVNHWIKIRLRGTKSNRSAIGARVLLRSNGKLQVQEVLSQSSYVSSNDPRLHFGLGAAEKADIELRWPLGAIEIYKGVVANQLVTFYEGSSNFHVEKLPGVPT
ncbi:CRTAC1 family protein [Tunturiibacter lichenicola]|uniref:CRTAC1 family protein n=1 Tax=Tunturiibacter lichenicola TaxID=2051959 RepID=UPI0021B18BF8|nr:CRTAC1 family protein [Edaphobacter lichenicola]